MTDEKRNANDTHADGANPAGRVSAEVIAWALSPERVATLVAALRAIADPSVRVDGRFAAFAVDRFRTIANAALADIGTNTKVISKPDAALMVRERMLTDAEIKSLTITD